MDRDKHDGDADGAEQRPGENTHKHWGLLQLQRFAGWAMYVHSTGWEGKSFLEKKKVSGALLRKLGLLSIFLPFVFLPFRALVIKY
jgi:hypothetical protein